MVLRGRPYTFGLIFAIYNVRKISLKKFEKRGWQFSTFPVISISPRATRKHDEAVAEKRFKKEQKKFLTTGGRWDIMVKVAAQEEATETHGEMSEWFKELVLKTSDSGRDRGFESHSLRQLNTFWTESTYMEKYPSGWRGSPGKRLGR